MIRPSLLDDARDSVTRPAVYAVTTPTALTKALGSPCRRRRLYARIDTMLRFSSQSEKSFPKSSAGANSYNLRRNELPRVLCGKAPGVVSCVKRFLLRVLADPYRLMSKLRSLVDDKKMPPDSPNPGFLKTLGSPRYSSAVNVSRDYLPTVM